MAFGAASLISLVQRWTGVEIAWEIAADALSLYRQMLEAFKAALFDWWTPVELPWGWTFAMPMWGMDVAAVWIVVAFSEIRISVVAGSQTDPFPLAHTAWSPWTVFLFAPLYYSARLRDIPGDFAGMRFAEVLEYEDEDTGNVIRESMYGSFVWTPLHVMYLTITAPLLVVAFFIWIAMLLTP